jgi:ribose-phosphate pyrophosphokinase
MHSLEPRDVRVFSGQSNPELAQGIADYLSVPLEATRFSRFSNDNLYIQLGASVRSRVVYIIQSLTAPTSDHLMELLMMLDIARSAGAAQIHAIIPYFSYARSDKKDAPRISITARLIADLLATAGATHVMTMTLHSPQVHGFFSLPTDPLTARHLFTQHFRGQNLDPEDTLVIAPDVGRAKPAARFAESLGLPTAAAQKTRLSDDRVLIQSGIERMVRGFRRALVYDDEIATGATVLELCHELSRFGIEDVKLICTHGVFSHDALCRLAEIPFVSEIVSTDTAWIPPEKQCDKLTVLSVAPVFGEAIWRNATRQTIGDLYTYTDETSQAENNLDTILP